MPCEIAISFLFGKLKFRHPRFDAKYNHAIHLLYVYIKYTILIPLNAPGALYFAKGGII